MASLQQRGYKDGLKIKNPPPKSPTLNSKIYNGRTKSNLRGVRFMWKRKLWVSFWAVVLILSVLASTRITAAWASDTLLSGDNPASTEASVTPYQDREQEQVREQEREQQKERERERTRHKEGIDEDSVIQKVYGQQEIHKGVRKALEKVKNPKARAVLQAILEGRSVAEAVYDIKAALESVEEQAVPELAEVAEQLQAAVQADTSLDEHGKSKLFKELGKILRKVGKWDKARDVLEEVLRQMPNDEEAYQELDKAYAALGDTQVKVFLRGRALAFDVPPRIEHGRVLVPIRALAEGLGAVVSYQEGVIIINKPGITVVLRIGSPEAQVNGEVKTLDVPALLVNGRTLVPLRFVSENLQANVKYYDESNLVAVTD